MAMRRELWWQMLKYLVNFNGMSFPPAWQGGLGQSRWERKSFQPRCCSLPAPSISAHVSTDTGSETGKAAALPLCLIKGWSSSISPSFFLASFLRVQSTLFIPISNVYAASGPMLVLRLCLFNQIECHPLIQFFIHSPNIRLIPTMSYILN